MCTFTFNSVVVTGQGGASALLNFKLSENCRIIFFLTENVRPKCKIEDWNLHFAKIKGKIEILSLCLSEICNFLLCLFLTHDAAAIESKTFLTNRKK